MLARASLRRTAAIAVTVAVTTGSALLLTACDPDDPANDGAGAASTAPASPGPATGKSGSAAPIAPVNKTAGTGLTVSNGTSQVVMNGTTVDFGTVVRDLAWSPDGKKAAFIDGSGNLIVSKPDGSGKVTVAKAPSGQNWSHPTWQVNAADQYQPVRSNILFTAEDHGVLRLLGVPSGAVDGKPEQLGLNREGGDEGNPLPQTGNQWPNAAGQHGSAVYANKDTGEVYVRDDYIRQQGSSVGKGSQPALSPNGEDIVFVRSVDGHDHIFEISGDNRTAKDLTPAAKSDCTEPAWAPDGRTIAFRSTDGIYTMPVNGSAAPTRVSSVPGLPAYHG